MSVKRIAHVLSLIAAFACTAIGQMTPHYSSTQPTSSKGSTAHTIVIKVPVKGYTDYGCTLLNSCDTIVTHTPKATITVKDHATGAFVFSGSATGAGVAPATAIDFAPEFSFTGNTGTIYDVTAIPAIDCSMTAAPIFEQTWNFEIEIATTFVINTGPDKTGGYNVSPSCTNVPPYSWQNIDFVPIGVNDSFSTAWSTWGLCERVCPSPGAAVRWTCAPALAFKSSATGGPCTYHPTC